MYKKTITYTDYNGVEREEDFYFHLTEAELFDLENSISGGYTAMVKRIIAAKNAPELIKVFKEIMQLSYGVKSDDGRRFIKNKEVLEEFTQTEAYSQLYMQLATNADAAAEFVNGVLPANVSAAANGVAVLPGGKA